MAEAALKWFDEELEAVRPPARITVSQWAERYRVLGGISAVKGPYQLSMVPFMVPMMDACNDWTVDEVVACKPAQIGGTDALLNVVGFFSDQDPSPVLIVLADQNTAEYVSTKKVQPMFKGSERLRRLYDPNTFTKNEISLRNGGYIGITWASSVSELATRPYRIVIFDEIDKPGYYVTTREADALSLGRERTNTYPEGYFKHLLTSTPTTEDGNISLELMSCDIIFDWHVPCPFCGRFQPLRWSRQHTHGFEDGQFRGDDGSRHRFGQVVWEGGRKASNRQAIETARYECGECEGRWNSTQKNEAVRNGKAVPRTEPTGFERKRGFHYNRIYSIFDGGRLEKMVQRWVAIHRLGGLKYHKALQGFINSTLAEPFKQVTVTSTETRVLKARCDLPPQAVPPDAVALTAGIDMQKYGFWFVVRAWARDYDSWLIHYGLLADWEEVEDLLFSATYPVLKDPQTGEVEERAMRIWRAGLDTGGGEGADGISLTEAAYMWLRRNAAGRGCRVWGTKGSSRPLAGKIHVSKPRDRMPSGKPIPGGLQIIMIDTDKCKDMVYYRLGQAIEGMPQGAHLHKGTDEQYARQILAEEKQRDAKGVEKWVQVKTDNHYFDAEVICQAVADPEWPGGGVNLLRPARHAARGNGESGSRRDENKGPGWLPRKGGWLNRR